MEPTTLRKGLLNTFVILILGAATAVVAVYANSSTGLVSAVFLLAGLIVCATAYFHMRLYEREYLERLEHEEIQRRATSESIFEEAEDLFPARQTRQNFEKYFVPFIAVLLLVIEWGGAYWLWGQISKDKPPATTHQATVAMALNGLFALLFFQFGKYSAVFARLEKQWLLRPQASYLLLGALLTLSTALVEVAGWSGYPHIDPLVARIYTIFLILVGVENLLTLIFEIYRPRVRTQEPHPLYESRLIGMLSQPGGIFRTVAQAIDYQFGWKVSETWFYQFLEKSFGWLLLLQLAVLDLSTCFVVIEPGQAALLEHWGKFSPEHGLLGPGFHIKWPWPIDRIYRYKTDLVQMFTLGLKQTEAQRKARVLLWTRTHAEEEYNILVASRKQLEAPGRSQTVPVNLLSVSIPIQYQISDLVKYAYNHADPGALLQSIANRELTRYLASVDLYDVMGPGRAEAAETLRQRIQKRADELELGVKILFVGLHGIHPPVKVASNFEEVIGAIEEAEATNHYARAYAAERIPLAEAEAAQRTNRAAAFRTRLVSLAQATASQFTNQMVAFEASPQIYPLYVFLDRVADSIAGARKYIIVPTNADQVLELDLQDKIRPDLLNVTLGGTQQQGTE